MDLRLQDGNYKTIWGSIVDVVTAPITKHPIPSLKLAYLASNMSLAEPIVMEQKQAEIDVLIGLDYFHDIIDPQRLQVGEGLYLQGSKFGWMLSGCIQSENPNNEEHVMLIISEERRNVGNELAVLHHKEYERDPDKVNLENLFSLDSVGIMDSPYTSDDDVVLQKYNESVSFENGRYQVDLPKKEEMIPHLPDNYELALGV